MVRIKKWVAKVHLVRVPEATDFLSPVSASAKIYRFNQLGHRHTERTTTTTLRDIPNHARLRSAFGQGNTAMVTPPSPPPSSAGPPGSRRRQLGRYTLVFPLRWTSAPMAIYDTFNAIRQVWFGWSKAFVPTGDGNEVWTSGSGSTMHMAVDGVGMYYCAARPPSRTRRNYVD